MNEYEGRAAIMISVIRLDRSIKSCMVAALLGAVASLGPVRDNAHAADLLASDAALPADIPPGTTLVIGDPMIQAALELSGDVSKLPFKVQWANISGGPQTIEAFRGRALDVGSVADIPPIFATWTGLSVKIVAAEFRNDPIERVRVEQ